MYGGVSLYMCGSVLQCLLGGMRPCMCGIHCYKRREEGKARKNKNKAYTCVRALCARACVRARVCARVCARACVRARMCARVCARARVRARVCAPRVRALCARAVCRVRARVRAACARVCVHARVCACVCACARVRARVSHVLV